MSKQTMAKEAQGLVGPGDGPQCKNCLNYSHELDDWGSHKKIRCKLGGFATKQTAYCNSHVPEVKNGK